MNEQRMPARVLVVDDNPPNARLAAEILRLASYEVRVASSAEEGLGQPDLEGFDLVLMDVELPGMDGLEATLELHRSQRTSHIPVVAVSARARPEDAATALEAGCVSFVSKPYAVRTLLDAVEGALAQGGGGGD